MNNASKEEIQEFMDSLMVQLFEKDQIISTLSDQSKIIMEKLQEMEEELITAYTEMKDLSEKTEASESKMKSIEDMLDEFFKDKGFNTSDFYEFVTELKFRKGKENGDSNQ
jgi:chaperonin cofactor prefoldin